MSLHAFNAGANAVCYRKDSKQYGMICAWAQMIDYESVAMLLGEQSATGNNLKEGDIVGISALASNQQEIALCLGNEKISSKDHDKVNDIKDFVYYDKSAILIQNAKVNMVAKVRKIMKLNNNCEDHFIVFDILNYKQNEKAQFLSAYFMED